MPASTNPAQVPIAAPSAAAASGLYHDIYDFSLFPVSLGDIVTWGVKSALRAEAAGRSRVHVHLICDPEKAGFNAFQASNYLADLLVVEVLPAFYSHPRFAGVSVHRSREDFTDAFRRISETDPAAARLLAENQARYEDRHDFERTCLYFSEQCTFHHDINDYFRRTGSYPHVGYLKDCLRDWQALQAEYPKETFWVCVQFRLRRLDSGMPTTEEGLDRDAPFLAWFEFIKKAATLFPFVRFVLLGRLQEKPLELLRLPNVVVLRPLGMGLAHEITALLHSDYFIGSPSGFAQAAHFSETPYDVFSCNLDGCKNYGIPLGTPRLPNATERQVMHYEKENAPLLLETLERAIAGRPPKTELPGRLQVNRATNTDRFFLTETQGHAELVNILSSRLMAAARSIENGDLQDAQQRLAEMETSFPDFAARWTEFRWLTNTTAELVKLASPGLTPEQSTERRRLLAEVARYCHPTRLIRRASRFFDNILVAEGFRKDGWCEKRTRLVFGPSDPGDYLVIHVNRVSSSRPQRSTFQVNGQKPVTHVLLNDISVVEIPILAPSIPTELVIESEYAHSLKARIDIHYSLLIEEAGLISELPPMPSVFRGNKRELREQTVSGIRSDGWCSSLVHVRLDSALPGGTPAMMRIEGVLPRFGRGSQHFSVQVNDDPACEATIRGKHFLADVPVSGEARHVVVTLRFPGRDPNDPTTRDMRARILVMEIVPATVQAPIIRSGLKARLATLFQKQRSRRATS